MVFYHLKDEEMSALDVLQFGVVLRIVGRVDSRFTVQVKFHWLHLHFALGELVVEGTEVHGFFCGFRGRHYDYLSFARTQGHGHLFLRSPGDRSPAKGEDKT